MEGSLKVSLYDVINKLKIYDGLNVTNMYFFIHGNSEENFSIQLMALLQEWIQESKLYLFLA